MTVNGPYKRKDGTLCWKEDKLCNKEECPYNIPWIETGNCVLRVKREHTLDEIGIAMHFRKQRAKVLLDRALMKFKAGIVKEAQNNPELKEALDGLGIRMDKIIEECIQNSFNVGRLDVDYKTTIVVDCDYEEPNK